MIIMIKKSDVNIISDVILKLKDSNGDVSSDPGAIANVFDKCFVNISHKVTKSIPSSKHSPTCFMGKRVDNSIFISPFVVWSTDIINLLKSGQIYRPKQHLN